MAEWKTTTSKEMYGQGARWLAGGVGSMARGTGAGYVAPPIVVKSGKGSRLTDVDGNEYIDYLLALGPLIHGHRPEGVTRAVMETLQNAGSMLGLSTELEYQVAQKVVQDVPGVEQVRFSNSGTEAVLMALRLARGYTGKEKVIRFEGHFHGWGDAIQWSVKPPLAAAGLSHAPRAVPATAGIPEVLGSTLIVQPWNDPDVLERTVRGRAHEIAAIIMEPLMANCGCVEPKAGYLQFVRDLATKYGIVLILDEVITGFRLALGGGQAYYGVTPDLTTMAKALGAGYPVSAVGGKAEIMSMVARNEVTYLGTYNTSGTVMAAAKATLEGLEQPGTYERLLGLGDHLKNGLRTLFVEAGIPCTVLGPGSVFQLWFTEQPPTNYRESVKLVKAEFFLAFHRAMLRRGVLFHPSATEHFFISTAHTEADVNQTLSAAADAIKEIKGQFR